MPKGRAFKERFLQGKPYVLRVSNTWLGLEVYPGGLSSAELLAAMIVDSTAEDIVYSSLFTGVHGNYLAPSVRAAGMDPTALPEGDLSTMNFGSDAAPKAWKEIWGCGQGIGAVKEVVPAAELVARLVREYAAAKARLLGTGAELRRAA